MEQVKLGKTDIAISAIGVGAWAWGDKNYWRYGEDFGEQDVREAFTTSLEKGVNWIDTAEIYGFGNSEKLIGQFMRESGQNPLIASKFFPYPWRWGKWNMQRAIKSSLERLQISAIDLYQIHGPLPPISIKTWMNGLADAHSIGQVRAVGVSNYNLNQMKRAYQALQERGVPLASNQVEYSLLNRNPEKNGVLELCRELNVTLIAYSPLAQGLLTGKYNQTTPMTGIRARTYNQQRVEKAQPLIQLLKEIGLAHGDKTPAQVALNWLLCKGTVPIPGAKNAKQASENADAAGWRLTNDEVELLDKESAKNPSGEK